MINILYKYLRNSNIDTISKEDMYLQLLSHGDYPSLRSVTDTLDYFGIDNIAANVPKDALDQLPNSFLALVSKNNNQELVQVIKGKHIIGTKNQNGNSSKLSIEKFKETWTGTLIAVEEKKSLKKKSIRSGYSFSFLSLIILVVISSFLLRDWSLGLLAYLFLAYSGVGISLMVIKEELGYVSPITRKVCGAIAQNASGCISIIKSKKGKVLKGVGLGDLSFIYFTSICLTSIFSEMDLNLFYLISICSLPVVLYSLYVQGLQLKEWCVLCLGIGAILLGHFGILYFEHTSWIFSLENSLHFVVFTLTAGTAWFSLKPLLKNEKKLAQVQTDFLKFKKDENVFQALLEKNKVYNLKSLKESDQMSFGSKNAPIQLVAYTNPLCGYCKEAFEAYDRLIKGNPSDVYIQFVFITPKDVDNPSTRISKRLFELYDEDEEEAYNALKYWFEIKNIKLWETHYGKANTMLLRHNNILQAHRELTISNDILYTPETLIGRYKFPRERYEYKDLIFFRELLKQHTETSSLVVAL